jgi:apolipoprotein N-acyltransferase
MYTSSATLPVILHPALEGRCSARFRHLDFICCDMMPKMKIWHALVIGGLMAACGLPLPWSPLLILPLALLFAGLAGAKSPKEATKLAFFAATAYFSGHLLWLPISFASMLGWISSGFAVVFALEGIFVMLLALIVSHLTSRPERRIWLYAGGWVLLEYLRHVGAFAFPWGTVGYSLLPTPLVQVAEFGGIFMLSLMVTGMAAALARAWKRSYLPLMGMSVVWVASLGYGMWQNSQPLLEGDRKALLVQPNYDTFRPPAQLELLEKHLALSQNKAPDELVVWSEGVARELLLDPQRAATLQNTNGLMPWDATQASRLPKPLVMGFGAVFRSGNTVTPINRLIGWDGKEYPQHHDKVYPVPLGEFFPLYQELPWLYHAAEQALNMSLESLTPGTSYLPLELRGIKYGAYICYESVFPIVSREMVRAGAQVLVNSSNDGWFGKSQGLQQHFDMGRVRAIETRRFILRAGSIGVTAVIDERGNVRSSLTPNQEGALHVKYRTLEGKTLYVQWGDWPLIACLLLIGWVLVKPKRHEFRV